MSPLTQFLRGTLPLDVDTGSTSLDTELRIPWQSTFELGSTCLDAVTGLARASALLPPSVPPHTSLDGLTHSESLTTRSQHAVIQRLVASRTGVAGSFNSVSFEAGLETEERLFRSSRQVSVILHCVSKTNRATLAPNATLTREAKASVANPARFRDRYGDYFVAGCSSGSEFYATIDFNCESEETAEHIRSSMQTAINLTPCEKLQVANQLATSESRHSQRVHVAARIVVRGVTAAYQGPQSCKNIDDVVRARDSFRANLQPLPCEAVLYHFSRLEPAYPRQIALPSHVFVELSRLRDRVQECRWSCIRLTAHLIPAASKRINIMTEDLRARVSANAGVLANDTALRRTLLDRADDVAAQLQALEDKVNFILELREADREVKYWTNWNPSTWHLGVAAPQFARYRAASEQYSIARDEGQQLYREPGVGEREHSHSFLPRNGGASSERLIVGYEVHVPRGHGGKLWPSNGSTQLLGHQLDVCAVTAFSRGCDWYVTLYHVPLAAYSEIAALAA